MSEVVLFDSMLYDGRYVIVCVCQQDELTFSDISPGMVLITTSSNYPLQMCL